MNPSEIPSSPSRVILQDFTGVPAVVDIAALRDAMVEMGGNPERVNPQVRGPSSRSFCSGRRLWTFP